ncbi:hypothetical protein [uncultured Croceitalea sp.]|uniref:hypothetical protein n=1 Tax=uncultured Croceitalea sp. TaxID=1798908 RepID=UPI003305EB4E
MSKHIIIASADIYAIGYSQTADGSHVPVRWWPDLKSLDNIVFTPFKIQIEQDESGPLQKQPKAFVSHIVESADLDEAIKIGIPAIQAFLNHLSIIFEYGFKMNFDETFVLNCDSHVNIEIPKVRVITKNGIVNAYQVLGDVVEVEDDGTEITAAKQTDIKHSYIGSLKNKSYLTAYFTCTNPRAQNLNISAHDRQLGPSELPPEKNIQQLFNSDSIFHLISNLWVDAITQSDVVRSYISLWQIVEIFNSEGESELMFDDEQINSISEALNKLDLDKETINNRIINLIKGMPSATFVEKTRSGFSKQLPDLKLPDDFDKLVRTGRKFRGRYVHLREQYILHPDEFYTTYFGLKELAKSILRFLKKSIIIDDKTEPNNV